MYGQLLYKQPVLMHTLICPLHAVCAGARVRVPVQGAQSLMKTSLGLMNCDDFVHWHKKSKGQKIQLLAGYIKGGSAGRGTRLGSSLACQRTTTLIEYACASKICASA